MEYILEDEFTSRKPIEVEHSLPTFTQNANT